MGVDMNNLGPVLAEGGIAGFHDSFAHALGALGTKARELATL